MKVSWTNGSTKGRYGLRILAVLSVTLVGVGWALVYLRDSVRASNQMRAEAALKRNLALARMSARFLDERYAEVRGALRRTVGQPAVAEAVRAQDATRLRPLLRTKNLPPDVLSLTAYTANGQPILSVPDKDEPPRPILPGSWLAPVENEGRLVYLDDAPGTAGLVLPVGEARSPVGYLLAAFRFDHLTAMMADARPEGGGVTILGDTGAVLARTGEAIEGRTVLGTDTGAFVATRGKDEGTTVFAYPDGTHRLLVSYAAARQPGWVVLAAQPVEVALAPGRFLIRRFAYVALPGLVIVLIAAWVLASYFQRQRRMAQYLTEHNTQLQETDRAKSDFLANVSHDLKTPLSSLRITLSGLLDPKVRWEEGEVRACLQMASEQLELLIARVRNLLDMARLEAHAEPLQMEICDLTDITASAVSRMRPLLQGRPVTLDFPPEPLFVECDPAKIETVLINLLENAAKYSPPGTPLHLEGKARYPDAVMVVRDAGPGIAPGEEARVFEKFHRAPTNGSAGGTGLGLAICKSIVDMHQGDIRVRNAPEGGAEFWFSLPLPLVEMAVSAVPMKEAVL